MCDCIAKSSLLSLQTTNRGIINCFSGEKATSEQNHDMLQFRVIGTQLFLDYVSHRILMNTSTDQAPLRNRKLLTMSRNCSMSWFCSLVAFSPEKQFIIPRFVVCRERRDDLAMQSHIVLMFSSILGCHQ